MPDLSGQPPQLPATDRPARRAGGWLIWWVLMMSLWVILDDSLATDELLAGAGAAALAATLAELAGHQAGIRPWLRIGWLAQALRLPASVARDTWTVFAALWRQVALRQPPPSGFSEIAVRCGGQTPEARTRRALLIAGTSVAPNTLALGVDSERGVMVVHRLVQARESRPR